MTKNTPEALLESGTLVKCMSRGGVVVASSRPAPADPEEAAGDSRPMAGDSTL